MKMKRAMSGIRAGLPSGMRKQSPAASKDQALFKQSQHKNIKREITYMLGNVNRRRLRRPNVSMVQTAGKAKSQLTRPKPQEARRASRVV
jgi:predicted naringenin-chalcone synthase